MIDRVCPAVCPSNQEPQQHLRAPLCHRRPQPYVAQAGPPARQRSDARRCEAIASHTSESRQAKIAQLQHAVANGTYHTNGALLAAKIISETLVDILA
jgi:Anti-sigma-28 factor, FlgM